MKELLDGFWRALAYALHPVVLGATVLPLLVAGGGVFAVAWFGWEDAVAAVRATLEQWALMAALLQWLDAIGAGGLRTLIAPLVVVALATPVVVVLTFLLVAWLLTPLLVRRVVARRFPGLQARGGAAAWWQGLAWSLGHAGVALVALAATLPLWLVPPLAVVVPALIWGWLAARVLGFDVLATHAEPAERRRILREARAPMLVMGLLTGALGALPSLVWTLAGAAGLILAPVLMVAAVWLYTLVFALATLWFAHVALGRLHALRAATLSSAP